ncbi:MAG: hypothetical protein KGL35_14010 [Bradyrhizobium sp.]|nr:hypothetical protein [Bradyrhizobium sp.]
MAWRVNKPPGGEGMGPGWGGPAKGKGKPKFSAENQPAPELKSAGHAAQRTAREVAIAHAEAAAQVWIDVMNDPAQPAAARVAAASKIVEHAEGTPVARSIVATTDNPADIDDGARDRIARRIAELAARGGQSSDPGGIH